jgi:peptide/nickel transport system permease protein
MNRRALGSLAPLARNLRRSFLGSAGALVLAVIACLAIGAPLFAPYDPTALDLTRSLRAPTRVQGHAFGTDALGRDVLSRVVYGSRVSLIVGLAGVVVSGTVGTTLGLVCGYYGGRLDSFAMRVVDVQMAFPDILLAIAIMAVIGPGLINLVLVLGLTGWATYARIVRAEVLSLREREFVHAARAVGVPDRRLLLTHVLPNVIGPIIVLASFGVAGNIITESSLSFLGIGVKPSTPTWGSILADGRDYIRDAWWLTTFPGLATMVAVGSINVIGDWLRDYLDPKLRLER